VNEENEQQEPEQLGDEELQDLADEDEGPDASELDQEPDYNPDDEGLRGVKGG
jgi:hypothetical protein